MARKSDATLFFEQLQELITCIYDAALDENQWGSVLKTFASTFHAERGSMRMLYGESKEIQHAHTFNIDPSYKQSYNDYYIHIDPWVDLFLNQKATLSCSHHLLTDKDYESMEIYQDFVLPQGHHFGMGGMINISTDSACYISFQRAKQHEGFELEYLNALKILIPHIQKAVLINRKTQHIKFENDILSDALNKINSPVLLVKKYGKIIYKPAS